MDRRTFVNGIALGSFGVTLALHAQEPARIRKIGVLREGCQATPIGPSLVQALRALGWVEGQNISFELRCSDDGDQLPDLAADLVRQSAELIFTTSTPATRAAKHTTSDVPIVFSIGGDPVKRELVGSMSRPGGNLTGFAIGLYEDKQLHILKAALPGISRVACPVFAGAGPSSLLVNPDVAKALGVKIQDVAVQNLDDFGSFYTAARQAGADAAIIPDWPALIPRLQRIGMEASKNRLPAVGCRRVFAESGGLLSYAPMLSEMAVRQAIQIDKILRGVAKPADMPVEQPTRFEFVINLREAKALGLSIPRLVRLAADELIQ